MDNSNILNLISPCVQGVNFGFEDHQLTNSYDQFIIDPANGFIYILDDISCNAKKFKIKIFNQDLHYQNSFEIPDNLHSVTRDKGYATFGVNQKFIYFLNRTTLSIIAKNNFNTITRTVVNSPNDAWNRLFVGEQDSICLYRTIHLNRKFQRLEMFILADYKYSIKRRFRPEMCKLNFVSMTYNSVILLQEMVSQRRCNLFEISHDNNDIRSISLGYTSSILCFAISPTYILLLTTDSVLNIFAWTGEKRKHFFLRSIHAQETNKMIYTISYFEKTNSLLLYNPLNLSHLFTKFELTIQ